MRSHTILLADIGGTNIRFALADPTARVPLLAASVRGYRVAECPSLIDAAQRYFVDRALRSGDIERALFAAAGTVDGGVLRLTNHPWTVSIEQTRAALGLGALRVVNDFAAMSMSVPMLSDADVAAIGPAPPARAGGGCVNQTFAVLGPGTGLGVGALLCRDGRAHALETEGGHIGFAPGTAEEIEILQRLSARFGRVSNERLLCGGGLVNLHRAVCELAGASVANLTAEHITARARADTDPRCVRSVELFCAIFGAVAGDLALAYGAWDGVYLAGGMVPPLLPWLRQGGFRQRFVDKGRYAAAMQRVPILAIIHPHAGLLGAAALAMTDAGAS